MNSSEPELIKQKHSVSGKKIGEQLQNQAEQGEKAEIEKAREEDIVSFMQYALKHWKVLIAGMIAVAIVALLGFIWLYTHIFDSIRDLRNGILNTEKRLIHYIDNSIALIINKQK